jgi:hypothetical protein
MKRIAWVTIDSCTRHLGRADRPCLLRSLVRAAPPGAPPRGGVAGRVRHWQRRAVATAVMIPDEEFDRLTNAVDEAISLAAGGHLADGYTVLLGGLERTEALLQDVEP